MTVAQTPPTREQQLTEQMRTAFLYSLNTYEPDGRIPPPTFTWTFGAGTFEIRSTSGPLPEDLSQLVTGHHLGGPRTFKDATAVSGEWKVECYRGNDTLVLSEVKIDGWHFTGTGARLSMQTYKTGWIYTYGNAPLEVTFSVEPLPGQGPPRKPGLGPQKEEVFQF